MKQQTTQPYPALRVERKVKAIGKRIWRATWIAGLLVMIGGGVFLYGTEQGHQTRSMLVGTLLSSRHTGHLPFLRILLPQSEIDALYAARIRPAVVQSDIKPVKENVATSSKKTPATESVARTAISAPQPEEAKVTTASLNIEEHTVNETNFTAKVLVIPDPKTVHIVGTKYSDKGQALSELIADNGGVAGINAGGFIDPNGRGSGGEPTGIVIGQGKVLNLPGGNANVPLLIAGFLGDGQFITGNFSANQLLKLGVADAVSFGPQLIVNGKNVVTPAIDGAWGWAPRTAIGQTNDGKVVMIITDGRFYWDKTHRGAAMSDMARMMESYGVVNAIAMDGGGSTTMIKDGSLLLQPATSTKAGMRYLPDAWVVIPR